MIEPLRLPTRPTNTAREKLNALYHDLCVPTAKRTFPDLSDGATMGRDVNGRQTYKYEDGSVVELQPTFHGGPITFHTYQTRGAQKVYTGVVPPKVLPPRS